MLKSARPLIMATALILAMFSFVATAPASAAAQSTLSVTGSLESGGSFSGVLVDAEFATDPHDPSFLIIEGQLEGTAVINGEEVFVNVAVDHIATTEDASNCEEIHVIIAPIEVEELGTAIQLDRVVFPVPEPGLLGGLLGGGNGLFCAVDDLLGTGEGEDLAEFLNDLLDELGL